jgi:NAD(P)-dependent dehydrogenase (short-subunit alcohol dehydrogenase family)
MSLGTAVIVGVGPGLGLELARIFGDGGHPVAMLARDKAKLDTFAKELAAAVQDARGYVTDAAGAAHRCSPAAATRCIPSKKFASLSVGKAGLRAWARPSGSTSWSIKPCCSLLIPGT